MSYTNYDEYYIANTEIELTNSLSIMEREGLKLKEKLISILEEEGEIDFERKSHIRELIISKLNECIVGQDQAKKELARVIVTGFLDTFKLNETSNGSKKNHIVSTNPLGVFFFAGPSGVGKTQMAKSLAKIFLGSEDRLQDIAAEKFINGHEVSNLFGSAKGYVGYAEAPDLADVKIFDGYFKRKEELKEIYARKDIELTEDEKIIDTIVKKLDHFSILVFNEIEKAHYKFYNSLLTLIDDGVAKMTTGKEDNPKLSFSNKTDLSNTIIIMTSNVGNKTTKQSRSIGFGSQNISSDDYISSFKETFPPAFISRIEKTSKIIVFDKLNKKACKKILNKKIKEINLKIMESVAINQKASLGLIILDEVLDFVISNGYNEDYGARSLMGAFNRLVTDKIELASENGELYRKIEEGHRHILYIYMKNGEIKLNVKKIGKIEIPEKFIKKQESLTLLATLPITTSTPLSLVNAYGTKYSKFPILEGLEENSDALDRTTPNFSIGDSKIIEDFFRKVHNKKEKTFFEKFMEEQKSREVKNTVNTGSNTKISLPKGYDSFHLVMKEIQELEIEYVKTYCMSYEDGIDCSDRLKEIISGLIFLGITKKDLKDVLKSAMIASIDYLGFIDSYQNIILTIDEKNNNNLFAPINNLTIKKMVNHFITEALDMGLKQNSREMKEIISAIVYRIENLVDNTLNKKQLDALRELIAKSFIENK